MSNEIESIGGKTVLKVPENKTVQMSTLWANNTVVITYFRRFGCVLCRQGALELSKIAPILKAHNIRLIGIGLEELGAKEFIDGKFFSGELYVDVKAEQFKVLGFKTYNICNILYAMCERASREVYQLGKELDWNWKGNGYQTGGTLIINKGGADVILSYKMQGLADHLENEEILYALGIDPNGLELKPTSGPIVTQPTRNRAEIKNCEEAQCKVGLIESPDPDNKKDK